MILEETLELDLSSETYWIVRLNGGLGNQMHDFAAGWQNSVELGAKLVLDLSGLDALVRRGIGTPRTFGLQEFKLPSDRVSILGNVKSPLLLRSLRRAGYSALDSAVAKAAAALTNLSSPGTVREMKKIAFDSSFYDQRSTGPGWTFVSGLHLSYKYFDKVRMDLQYIFQPSTPLGSYLETVSKLLSQNGSTAVHVRRGDYVSSAATARKRVTSESYFRDGIEELRSLTPQSPVVFFSDDINWCREVFSDVKDAHFVEPNAGDPDAHHLFTMSRATNFVISNSSFSWWAAYLSSSLNKRVITPANWMVDGSYPMEDLVPQEWDFTG